MIENLLLFNSFAKGFISILDVDSSKAPKESFSDGANFEINDPIFALRKSDGYDTELVLPTYTGRAVAIHNWGVGSPSSKRITTLVTASDNLLKYSEDFEISSVWTLTAGGATLLANGSTGPLRMADKLSSISNTTSLKQTFTGTVAIEYTFSLYFNKTNAKTIRLSIVDDAGSTTATSADTSGTFIRLTVTRTIAGTNPYVKIDFPNGLDTDVCYIWGAKLESGATATTYGYTFEYASPYMIWMYPYWNGSAWVNEWREVTEKRAGKVVNLTSGAFNYFDCTGLDGADNYYNNWHMKGTTAAKSNFIADYATTNGRLSPVTLGSIANTDEFILSRSLSNIANQLSTTNVPDEKVITFLAVDEGLRISLGTSLYPLVLKYVTDTVGSFAYATNPITTYSQFVLTNTYDSTASGLIPVLTTATNGDGVIPTGIYYVVLTGSYDGKQNVYLGYTTVSITYPQGITYDINIPCYVLNLRSITSVSIYISPASETGETDVSAIIGRTVLERTLVTTIGTVYGALWHINVEKMHLEETGDGIDVGNLNFGTLNIAHTFLADIGKAYEVTLNPKYKAIQYINGRSFIAPVSDGANQIRRSSIRSLVSEVDLYPYVYSQSYGFTLVEPSKGDEIVGLGVTTTNDLLIFRSSDTFLYEVQSGRVFGSRMLNAFRGVGLAHQRLVVTDTDYGTFWMDANDAYWYPGGVNIPLRVSEDRVRQFIRQSIKDYLPYAFSIFNRKIGEWWTFLQVSGTIGSSSASDYRVLRYSPVKQNWNILQFAFVPIWVTQDLDGEIKILTSTGYYNYGSSVNQLPSANLTTHNIAPDGDIRTGKQIIEAFAKYIATDDLQMTLLIDNEVDVRNGNQFDLLYTKNNAVRSVRAASSVNTIRIKISETV